jgi:hypothetical protein
MTLTSPTPELPSLSAANIGTKTINRIVNKPVIDLSSFEPYVNEEIYAANSISDEALFEIKRPRTAVSRETVAAIKIRAIKLKFTKVVKDSNNRIIPVGKATAVYNNGSTLTVNVSGGANVPGYKITNAVKNAAIYRVEKSIYKNGEGDTMPYALFYNHDQALHFGRLDITSNGSIHIEDRDKMRMLNKDVEKNKTSVTVFYSTGILDKVIRQYL